MSPAVVDDRLTTTAASIVAFDLPEDDLVSRGELDALEQQLEARDPDVRLMLQVRDDVPGAFEALVERYQDRLVGILFHLVGSRRGGRGPQPGGLPADLQGAQGVSPPGQVLDLAVHDRQQPGAEPPARQGAEPVGAHERRGHRLAAGRPGRRAARRPGGHGLVPDAQGRALRGRPRGARGPERGPEDGRPAQQVRGHELRRDRRGDGPLAGGHQVAPGAGAERAPRAARAVPRRPGSAGRDGAA